MASVDLKSPYRLFGGFRLLLAALVFLQHALAELAPAHVESWLRPVEAGSIAVLIFFVLSGFIVTEAAAYFYSGRPVAFFVNRLLRIFPSYVIALLITLAVAAVLAWADMAPAVIAHLGALPAFSFTEFAVNTVSVLPGGKSLLDKTSTQPILDIAWALRVELAFYGILFAALAAAHWFRQKAEITLTATAIASLAVWGLSASAGQGNMLQFVPYFVFGAAMFYALHHQTSRGGMVAKSLAAMSAVCCIIALLTHETAVFAADAAHDRTGAAVVFAGLTVTWLVLLFLPTEKMPPVLVKWDKRLGEATFPLYLLHTAMSALTTALIPDRGWLALGVGMMLSLAVSFLAVVTYEKAIGRLRTRIRGRELDPLNAPPVAHMMTEAKAAAI